jgi:CheY-like chemotaxis protein
MEQRSKILVVDDDPDVIEAITTVLESRDDYDVRTARDGLECMQAVKEDLPDLLILDLLMPRMDGFAGQSPLSQTADHDPDKCARGCELPAVRTGDGAGDGCAGLY